MVASLPVSTRACIPTSPLNRVAVDLPACLGVDRWVDKVQICSSG